MGFVAHSEFKSIRQVTNSKFEHFHKNVAVPTINSLEDIKKSGLITFASFPLRQNTRTRQC